MGNPSVVCTSLGGTAGQNGSCVLSPPDEKADLKDWESLLNFRPRSVKDQITARFKDARGLTYHPDPFYHPIEDGYGALNLDFYPVQILKLPSIAGTDLPPEIIVKHVRAHLATLVDRSNSVFEQYEDCDGSVWRSDNPVGAVMHFKVNVGGAANVDDASVVAADFAADHWIFSTLPTPKDLGHPVSGNRQFGCATLRAGQSLSPVYEKAGVTLDNKGGDALYFYTRGADRCTAALDYVASATTNAVFAGGHALWLSLQQNVMAWIVQNGGQAVVPGNVSERWDWDGIKNGGFGALWHDPNQ